MFMIGIDVDGVIWEFVVNWYLVFYIGDYGDCMGGNSLFSISKFDVVYYVDNMMIVFYMDGISSLRNEFLMMCIFVDVYGENWFDKIVNFCNFNIVRWVWIGFGFERCIFINM